ncbi:MAG TPA: hypothetical protein VLM85_15610 [Polyangiaceae bacterium]|nr:hypothetical protein [Polyangiaceae bacterium]
MGLVGAASLVVVSTTCSNAPVECFVEGLKLNPSTAPSQCVYENSGSVCTDGHSHEVDCLDDTTCTCLVDGLPTGTLQKNGTECGSDVLFFMPDAATRYPPVAQRCGWNVVLTSRPPCPPNCSDAALEQ